MFSQPREKETINSMHAGGRSSFFLFQNKNIICTAAGQKFFFLFQWNRFMKSQKLQKV